MCIHAHSCCCKHLSVCVRHCSSPTCKRMSFTRGVSIVCSLRSLRVCCSRAHSFAQKKIHKKVIHTFAVDDIVQKIFHVYLLQRSSSLLQVITPYHGSKKEEGTCKEEGSCKEEEEIVFSKKPLRGFLHTWPLCMCGSCRRTCMHNADSTRCFRECSRNTQRKP
jgi:hypothetical protein